MTSTKCSECEAPVAAGGRRSKETEAVWCMRRPCQAAKQRHYRVRLRAADTSTTVLEETRPCAGCSEPQPARAGRVTDLALGRWCQKRSCQADKRLKRAIMAKVEDGTNGQPETMEINRLFWEAKRRENHKCSRCGLTGPAGFKHPTSEGQPCEGLGAFPVLERDAVDAFPERFPNKEQK